MFRYVIQSNLQFDNPLNRSQVPSEPLSISIPAKLQKTTKGEFYLIPILTFLVIFTSLFLWGKTIHQSKMDDTFHWFQFFASMALLIQIVRRSISPSRTTFYHLFGTTIGCAWLLSSTAYVENDVDRLTRVAIGASFVFELFIHKYMVRQVQKRNLESRPDLTLIHAGIISIASCVAMEIFDTIFAIYRVELQAVVASSLAIAICVARFDKGTLTNGPNILHVFFGYPDPADLAPGLIVSPSGDRMSRLWMISCFLISVYSRSSVYTDERVFVLYPFSLILCKVLIAVAAYEFLVPHTTVGDPSWKTMVDSMATSDNKIEQESFFVGRVEFDGSPVLLHKDMLSEHSHFLGDSGTGKTARGILPILSQAIRRMPFSVIIIDMKADTMEIASEADAANRELAKRTGKLLPFQTFDLSHNAMTYGFNPFLTTGWNHMSIQEKAETIACACGLDYGQNYGASFFGSANVAPLKYCLGENPNIASFRELYVATAKLLRSKNNNDLLPNTKSAASHVEEVLNRFGRIDSLNIGTDSKYSKSHIESSIDLGSYFVEQKLAYFSLPSTVSSMTSAGVGRMVVYLLMMAARHVERNHQVVVVIDEFQRLAVQNFESTLQLARSMGVSLVLANQSLQDLKTAGPQLLNSVETNCHFRQWFSVSSTEDIARLERLGGTRTEIEESVTTSSDGNSVTRRQVERVRLDAKHINAVSDDPNLSIVRIANDPKGYAKYGASPIVVRTSFHISAEEYKLRKSFEIPVDTSRMIRNTETNLRAVEPKSSKMVQPDLFDDPNRTDETNQSTSAWDPNGSEGNF